MTLLEQVATLVSLIGVPIALIGLWLSARQSANARDLQVILEMAEAFRKRWEHSWRDTLNALEDIPEDERIDLDREMRSDLYNLLNWIDWLGVIVKTRMLNNPDAILSTVGPQIRRAIELARPIISRHEKEHGADYWGGLRSIEGLLRNGKS